MSIDLFRYPTRDQLTPTALARLSPVLLMKIFNAILVSSVAGSHTPHATQIGEDLTLLHRLIREQITDAEALELMNAVLDSIQPKAIHEVIVQRIFTVLEDALKEDGLSQKAFVKAIWRFQRSIANEPRKVSL